MLLGRADAVWAVTVSITAPPARIGGCNRSFTGDVLHWKPPYPMPLIGYARISTEDQTPLPQSQALKSAGCAEIHEE